MSTSKSHNDDHGRSNTEDLAEVRVHVETGLTGEQTPNEETLSEDDLDKIVGGLTLLSTKLVSTTTVSTTLVSPTLESSTLQSSLIDPLKINLE